MLKEVLSEALKNKKNDITSYVWKGKKVIKNQKIQQDSKRLVDCTQSELKQFYDYCETMLYNNNKYKPGRYILLNIIKNQREKCNAELFVRWLERENGIAKYSFMATLREFLNNNPKTVIDDGENEISTINLPISKIVKNTPSEFSQVKIGDVLNACLDSLGFFDRRHLTTTFILKQGVYLTPEEDKKRDKFISKINYIKEYLDVYPEAKIKIDHRGLNLEQMKAMINLRSKKYSELSTLQLELLRNRILFALENEINIHIYQWEKRQDQIKKVAAAKGFSL